MRESKPMKKKERGEFKEFENPKPEMAKPIEGLRRGN